MKIKVMNPAGKVGHDRARLCVWILDCNLSQTGIVFSGAPRYSYLNLQANVDAFPQLPKDNEFSFSPSRPSRQISQRRELSPIQ